ncbi:MAG: hypothetical protein AAF531_23760 [Actinomycetota bacterium]
MAPVRHTSSAYSHRQTSWWPNLVLVIPGIVGLIVTITLALTTDIPAWFGVVFVVLLLVALIRAPFATLETAVSDGELRASFRPIGPTKVIRLNAITSHEQVRLPWYAGYGGLEWLSPRRSFLWSSSGRSAVEVHHRTQGGRDKRTYIGTDDAAGLAAAVRNATAHGTTRP